MSDQLEEELRERLHVRKLDKLTAAFSGACISKGHVYTTDNDQDIFVKTNSSLNASVMFNGELESLRQISATCTIRVPKGITVIDNYDTKFASAIVMEFLKMNSLSDKGAEQLGKDLAHLHDYNNKVIRFQGKASRWIGKQPPSVKHLNADRQDENDCNQDEEEHQFGKHHMRVGIKRDDKTKAKVDDPEYADRFVPNADIESVHKFGFDAPTSCGSVPQVNEWTEDWVSFYARHRLDVTIRSLLSDHSDRQLNELWSGLQLKVDKLFDDFDHRGSGVIVPALLHGDLWSGNAAQMADNEEAVVYDPASFFGHSEYEFGIVRMFGGFPSSFERAYFQIMQKKKNFEKRNKLYQLFHHLNHWNHFGSGYRPGSLSLMREVSQLA